MWVRSSALLERAHLKTTSGWEQRQPFSLEKSPVYGAYAIEWRR
jgi:hypothetical protein